MNSNDCNLQMFKLNDVCFKNHQVMSCSSESDRTRWLEAVTPRISENPEEKIYEEWDCPQVQTIHPYVATQLDELSLETTDVVNVLRKMADGTLSPFIQSFIFITISLFHLN